MSEIPIITVSELNAKAKFALEDTFGIVAVSGEISNITTASSGHCYFTLKDKLAQIRCAFFSYGHKRQGIKLQNGIEIIAHGKVSLYEPRGDYQLIVSHVQDNGLGLLFQQFVALKNKLEAQGLFATSRKKTIPKFPEHIAIITSPKGAALHDIQSTLQRRFPLAKTSLFASEVQGANAPVQLIAALSAAELDNTIDCIILARGGGSIEDLWAFNNETLALKIANCSIPIIAGIGHETDFTIADFVADFRAATPTAAAEKSTPDQYDLLQQLSFLSNKILGIVQNNVNSKAMQLKWCSNRLSTADKVLQMPWQRLDYGLRLIKDKSRELIRKKLQQAVFITQRLELQKPATKLATQQEKLSNLLKNMSQHANKKITAELLQVSRILHTLQALSPLATLQRGYAIASVNKQIISNANQVKIGDEISLMLAQGKIISIAKDIDD